MIILRKGLMVYLLTESVNQPTNQPTNQSTNHRAESFLKLTGPQLVKKSRILWILEVQYRIHKSPPPVPVLSEVNTFHASIPLLKDPF
jgi:hypothetical protein